MNKNYTVYLGSSSERDYQESIKHVIGSAEYVLDKGYADERVGINAFLNRIYSKQDNVLFCMENIGVYYEAKSSLDLLLNSDVITFKQDSYVGAKLQILGSREPSSWLRGYNTSCLFLPIMSDNPDLINFIIDRRNDFVGAYNRRDNRRFSLKIHYLLWLEIGKN